MYVFWSWNWFSVIWKVDSVHGLWKLFNIADFLIFATMKRKIQPIDLL
jgi:hypothetical protein